MLHKQATASSEQELRQAIQAKSAKLEALKETHHRLTAALSGDPQAIVSNHIRLLKLYNELRDGALGMVAQIAAHRGMRVEDILEEMGACVDY